MSEPLLEVQLESGADGDVSVLAHVGPRRERDIGELMLELLGHERVRRSDESARRLRCTGSFVEHAPGLKLDAATVARLSRERCSLDIQLTRDVDAFVRNMRTKHPEEDVAEYVAAPGASPEGVVYFTVDAVGLDREAISERLGLDEDEFWTARARLTVGDRRRYGTWVLSSGFLALDDFTVPLDEMLERIEGHATALVGLVESGLSAGVDFVETGLRTPVVPRLILDERRLARIAALRAGIWLDITG